MWEFGLDFKLSAQYEPAQISEAKSRETSCCFRSCFNKIKKNFFRSLKAFQTQRLRLKSKWGLRQAKASKSVSQLLNRTCAACGWVSEGLFSSVGVWQSSRMISSSSPCLDEYYAGFNLELFWQDFIFLTKTIPNCPVVREKAKTKKDKETTAPNS